MGHSGYELFNTATGAHHYNGQVQSPLQTRFQLSKPQNYSDREHSESRYSGKLPPSRPTLSKLSIVFNFTQLLKIPCKNLHLTLHLVHKNVLTFVFVVPANITLQL
jgi:hypothetical protein